MPTAFVSYAREDAVFTNHLVRALEKEGVTVAGDWALTPGPDYSAQLRDLILRADAIVAVVSPSFAASSSCRWEIDTAVALQKRLLPVLKQSPPDDGVLHAALRLPQWVVVVGLREDSTEFVARVSQLVDALHTDFELMEEHTRLLVEADGWDSRRRAADLLLRGTHLVAAELFLVRSDARAPNLLPRPTALQREFVATSRASARRRRAHLITLALLLMATATVAAQMSAVRARTLRFQALTQALVARGVSEHLRADQDERGALLLRQAVTFLERHGDPGAARAQLDAGLRQSLGARNFRAVLEFDAANWATAVAIDHAGAQVAVGADNGGIYVVDVVRRDGPRRLHRYDDVASDRAVHRLLFGPDDRHLFAARGDGTVVVYALDEGSSPRTLLTTDAPVFGLAFEPRSATLAIGDGQGRLWVQAVSAWDAGANPAPLATSSPIRAMAFSPDGRQLVTGHRDGVGRLWSRDTRFQRAIDLPGVARLPDPSGGMAGVELRDVAFSPDGTRVAGAAEDFTLWVWSLTGTPSLRQHAGHVSSLLGVAFTPDGTGILTASDDNRVGFWDARDPASSPEFADGRCGAQVSAVAVAPAGDFFVTACSGATRAVLWDVRRHTLTPQDAMVGHGVHTLAVTNDDRHAVVGGYDGRVSLVSLDTLSATLLVSASEDGSTVQVATAGAAPVGAWCDGQHVGVIEWTDAQPKASLLGTTLAGRCRALSVSVDGQFLAAGDSEGAVSAWRLPSRSALPGLGPSSTSVSTMAWLDGGGRLLVLDEGGQAVTWPTRDPVLTRRSIGDWPVLHPKVRVSRDSNRLLLADFENRLMLLRLPMPIVSFGAAAPALRVPPQGANVEALAIDAPGNRVAVLVEGGIIRIYRATGTSVAPIETRDTYGREDATQAIDFASTTDQLVTGTSGGRVRLVPLSLAGLAKQACDRVWRNLTRSEWDEFVGADLPYERTCEHWPAGEGVDGAPTSPRRWRIPGPDGVVERTDRGDDPSPGPF